MINEKIIDLPECILINRYPVQLVQVKHSIGRSWYTVRIGDYTSKEAAQARADEFSAREKIETAVRPFGQF